MNRFGCTKIGAIVEACLAEVCLPDMHCICKHVGTIAPTLSSLGEFAYRRSLFVHLQTYRFLEGYSDSTSVLTPL